MDKTSDSLCLYENFSVTSFMKTLESNAYHKNWIMKKLICWADKMLSKRQMRKMIGGTNDKTCTVFIPRTQTVHPNLTEEQAKFLIEASGGGYYWC